MTPAKAAELALLVVYAMDMREAEPASLNPSPDPRIASTGWNILGYIVGTDALLRPGRALVMGDAACYGYVVQSKADPRLFAAAIRGTSGVIEWIEDAKFLPMPHPVSGKVETGFYTLYETLEYVPAGSNSRLNLVSSLTNIAKGGHLLVLGHSLGAPLATYLTFDLAAPDALGDGVEAVLFASPRPGDDVFAQAFERRVAAYNLWNFELDIVPRVPIGDGYSELAQAQWINPDSAQARIGFSLSCHHHMASYAAMLDYNLLDWTKLPACDQAFAQCIKGANYPASGAPAPTTVQLRT